MRIIAIDTTEQLYDTVNNVTGYALQVYLFMSIHQRINFKQWLYDNNFLWSDYPNQSLLFIRNEGEWDSPLEYARFYVNEFILYTPPVNMFGERHE